jgi:hypothetical protein
LQISATRYEISRKKTLKKENSEIFREKYYQFFGAIVVPQPIWGMRVRFCLQCQHFVNRLIF